jgi:predicted RNA-binding Zn ribbon-like protein
MAMTSVCRSEFLFLGEHPAIDFANTQMARRGRLTELLCGWEDVVGWLEKAGVVEDARLLRTAAAPGQAVERVRGLRDAWRRQISRLTAGGRVSPAFVRVLNQFLEKDTFAETLRSVGAESYRMQRSPPSLRGADLALTLLARQIALFLVSSNLSYLRRCANSECVLYFYDTTKNHRRHWCSAAICGNRHKVAAFRERQARKSKTQ